jgi:sugar phosphate isomerase/epimerase
MDEVQEVAAPVDLGKLTTIYIKIRDKRAENKREFEEADADLKEQMEVLEAQMLDVCKEMNADSIRTPHGTIIRSVKSRYWTNDWDSMYDFIEKEGAFGLLEKRLHQTNMKDFLAENPDLLPAGLNVENSYSVVVRRSKEK